jgi:hypothetical protein
LQAAATLLHKIVPKSGEPIWSAVFTVDGSILATGTGSGNVELWGR